MLRTYASLDERLQTYGHLSKRLWMYGSLSKRLWINGSLSKSLQPQAQKGICWLPELQGCKSHVGFGLNEHSEAPAATKSHSASLKEALPDAKSHTVWFKT